MLNSFITSVRATIVLAILTGLVFPLIITVIAQGIFPWEANGSLIRSKDNKTVLGSALLAQGFTKPEYFHPRPSAAGSGYAGEASGGTNLGPTSKKLILGDQGFSGVKQLAQQYRSENSLAPDYAVPVDAVTRSASGLDPDISVANALLQAPRIAKARKVPIDVVNDFVRRYTIDRDWGFLGEPRVNVLKLNLALDQSTPS